MCIVIKFDNRVAKKTMPQSMSYFLFSLWIDAYWQIFILGSLGSIGINIENYIIL